MYHKDRIGVCVWVHVWMCVCVSQRQGRSVCMCVYVSQRQDRSVCMGASGDVCMYHKDRVGGCVCVYHKDRVGVCVCVCMYHKDRIGVCVWVHLGMCVCITKTG